MSVLEIRDYVGADSLGYLSLDGLIRAIDVSGARLCQGCFTGHYPVPVQLDLDKLSLERESPPAAPAPTRRASAGSA